MTGEQTADDGVEARERDFWDHHIYSVKSCLRTIERGGSPNMASMIDDVLVQFPKLWFLSYHQVVVCRLDRSLATD